LPPAHQQTGSRSLLSCSNCVWSCHRKSSRLGMLRCGECQRPRGMLDHLLWLPVRGQRMVTDGIRRQLIDNDRAGREPEGVLPAQGEPSNAAWWGLRARLQRARPLGRIASSHPTRSALDDAFVEARHDPPGSTTRKSAGSQLPPTICGTGRDRRGFSRTTSSPRLPRRAPVARTGRRTRGRSR